MSCVVLSVLSKVGKDVLKKVFFQMLQGTFVSKPLLYRTLTDVTQSALIQ